MLAGNAESFFTKVLTEYFGGKKLFKGAIYCPSRYLINKDDADEEVGNQSQENFYGIMCRFLVNRFESSFAAFKKSVESIKEYSETALKYFNEENQFVLCREFFKRIEGVAEGDAFDFKVELQQYIEGVRKNGVSGKKGKPKAVTLYPESAFEDVQTFKDVIQADIDLLDTVLEEIDTLKLLESGNDLKLNALIDALKRVLADQHRDIKPEPGSPVRKVIVFSVFADTIEYIGKKLHKEFGRNRVLVVTGNRDTADPEIETLTDKVRETIIQNFDPKEGKGGSIDILVATDKISEGMNLNRAGLVVNYDIPWNPTRVIQRIGRINRISKQVFKNIYVMNLFPTDKGEEVTHKYATVKTKLQMIHDILCEDAQVLDLDESPKASDIENRINGAVDALEEATLSLETKVKARLDACKKKYKGIEPWRDKLNRLACLPPRLKTVAKIGQQDSLTLFREDRFTIDALRLPDIHAEEAIPELLPFWVALETVAYDNDISGDNFDEPYWAAYQIINDYCPMQKTLRADNLWNQAYNVLDNVSLYEKLPENFKETRNQLRLACLNNELTADTKKRISRVKNEKDLSRVLLEWQRGQSMGGTIVKSSDSGVPASKVPLVAFGTKAI